VWASGDRRRLRSVAIIGGIFLVATVVLLAWWSGLPDSKSLTPTMPDAHLISAVLIKDAGFVRLTGLILLPVVVLAGPVLIVRRAWEASRNLTLLVTGATALWLLVMYLRVPRTPFVGNYLSRQGVLSTDVLAGRRPDVIPSELFNLLVLLGSVAGIVVVLAAVPFAVDMGRRIRERDFTPRDPSVAVLGWVIAGFAAAYSLAIATGLPLYDRYALPILPLIAFLVLRSGRGDERLAERSQPRRVWAGVAIAGIFLLGLAFTADSASFDGGRWKVSEAATEAGFRPLMVGGGFEWLSYHREHGPLYRWDFAKDRPVKLKRYATPCVNVVINPPPQRARRIVAQVDSSALSRSSVPIVALRNRQPCVAGRRAVLGNGARVPLEQP
jgi:hypothetical protein